jgi:hypothetical protein
MLALDPSHVIGLKNLPGYENAAKLAANSPPEPPPTRYRDPGTEVYRALCRGEKLVSFQGEALNDVGRAVLTSTRWPLQLDEATRSTLRCRYVHHGSWFLRLARLKEEEAFLSPRILLYHDVISDAEINSVVAKAQPKYEFVRRGQ